MSELTKPHPLIPPEIDAEMTPAVRAWVVTLIAGFEAQIAVLNQQIVLLQSRVDELEVQVKGTTPQNSSVPPSTVHPHAKPSPLRPKSTRKRGGQKGHPRHRRELVPSEQCKEVLELKPDRCRKCERLLAGCDVHPIRHQVCEITPFIYEFVEYRLHRLHCPGCGITTCAELPEGVPQGQSGPRLMAFTAMLMGHFRQSKRLTSEFLRDLLNLPCCPSLTVKIQNQVSKALAAPFEELKQALPSEFNLHMDETPTKQASTKAWLWTAVAKSFVVFSIFPSRAGQAVTELLGENFQGIVNCDRAKMYFQLPHLQWCWAHLARDFQAMIDSKVADRVELGEKLSKQMKVIFTRWHRFKANEITWDEFRWTTSLDAKRFNALLYEGTGSHDSKLRNQCKSLHAHSEHLWRFLTSRGVEPTNNQAERALRPAVIYRKLSFGTQSEAGSRFVERIFSVLETCRMQKLSGFEFLVDAIKAKLSKQPAPKLLTNP